MNWFYFPTSWLTSNIVKRCVLMSIAFWAVGMLSYGASRIEPVLDSLCVVVHLSPNGDAEILEKRVMRVEGDYSEGFTIVAPLEEGSHLKDFKVFDNHGDHYYEYVADWSTVHGLNEQADKCSIMYGDDGGYKLCWGMGHEGYREYWVKYVITSLVRGYGDCDALKWQFIAPGGKPLPRFFCVIMSLEGHEFVPEEVETKVFGFPRKARIDGTVTVWPIERQQLLAGEYVTIQCRFKKGIFTPDLLTDEKFEGHKSSSLSSKTSSSRFSSPSIVVGLLAIAVFVLLGVIAFVSYTAYVRRRR